MSFIRFPLLMTVVCGIQIHVVPLATAADLRREVVLSADRRDGAEVDAVIELGELVAAETVPLKIVVNNQSGEPVSVKNVRFDCKCITGSVASTSIGINEEAEFEFKIRSRKGGRRATRLQFEFERNPPLTIESRMDFLPPYEFIPPVLPDPKTTGFPIRLELVVNMTMDSSNSMLSLECLSREWNADIERNGKRFSIELQPKKSKADRVTAGEEDRHLSEARVPFRLVVGDKQLNSIALPIEPTRLRHVWPSTVRAKWVNETKGKRLRLSLHVNLPIVL